MSQKPIMPSDAASRVGLFDRCAGGASLVASRVWFSCCCVVIVVVGVPSFFILQDIDTWQLIINTITTIVTFLLVALLQNTQTRSDQAIQHKLNAIADVLKDAAELLEAVGLEERKVFTRIKS